MKTVTDPTAVSALFGEMLASCVTGGIPDRETLERESARGTLFVEESDDGMFLLRRRDGFYRMNFCIADKAALGRFRPEYLTVTEIPYRERTGSDLPEKLGSGGWRTVLRRVRLRRAASFAEGIAENGFAVADPREALRILGSCFSPLTACLPTEEELEKDAEDGRLLYKNGGILRFGEKGNLTEIRHLAVLPEFRNRGTAGSLIRRYLSLCGGRASRVWTGSDNAPALRLYEKSGYSGDGWVSSVLVFEP